LRNPENKIFQESKECKNKVLKFEGTFFFLIIHAAKTRCIAFVFLWRNIRFIKTVAKVYFAVAKEFFIRTSADKCVSAVIYNPFLSLVIARLIENNG